MTAAIEIQGLTKRFARTSGYREVLTFWRRQHINALNGVDLSVPRVGICGLLGPNGAGKTTLLKILAGLVLPDDGRVEVSGISVADNPKQAKNHLMYVSPEERSLNWRLTGRENLKFFAVLYEVPARELKKRVAEVLSIVDLSQAADQQVGRYSSGMKQRLSIARGLLSNPEILLLDEPTRSLDPLVTRQMWTFIKEQLVEQQQKTILLATHNMEEAASVCDRVAILHQGRVKVCDTVEAVTARLAGQSRFLLTLTELLEDRVPQLEELGAVQDVVVKSPNGHPNFSLEMTVTEPQVNMPRILARLIDTGAKVVEVHQIKPALGDSIASLLEEAR